MNENIIIGIVSFICGIVLIISKEPMYGGFFVGIGSTTVVVGLSNLK